MNEDTGVKFKAQREIACKDIEQRWGNLPAELLLPAFLDLRFKDLDFLDSAREDKTEELIRMLKTMTISDQPKSEIKPTTSRSKLAKIFGSDGKIKKKSRSELERYEDEEMVLPEEDFDALAWWKGSTKKYPKLSAIAHDALSIPASSAPVERLFRMAGDVVTKKRNKLAPDLIDSLLILKAEKKKEQKKDEEEEKKEEEKD